MRLRVHKNSPNDLYPNYLPISPFPTDLSVEMLKVLLLSFVLSTWPVCLNGLNLNALTYIRSTLEEYNLIHNTFVRKTSTPELSYVLFI